MKIANETREEKITRIRNRIARYDGAVDSWELAKLLVEIDENNRLPERKK